MSDSCPSCGAKLQNKALSFNNNQLLTERQNKIVSLILQREYKELCYKCGSDDYYRAQSGIGSKIDELKEELNSIIASVPLVTIHNPAGWDYEVIGMATAQSATGTGVLTEFISTFADLSGMQSDRHKSKLKAGEELCKNQLQMQAIDMGGNAIIGVDIDYSEIGSGKGILMVCMAGTAVKLNNIEALSNRINTLDNIPRIKGKLNEIYDLARIE